MTDVICFDLAASEYINGVKTTAQEKADSEVAAHKASLEKELSAQLATLAADKESTLKAVEGSVNELAKDIIAKVSNHLRAIVPTMSSWV